MKRDFTAMRLGKVVRWGSYTRWDGVPMKWQEKIVKCPKCGRRGRENRHGGVLQDRGPRGAVRWMGIMASVVHVEEDRGIGGLSFNMVTESCSLPFIATREVVGMGVGLVQAAMALQAKPDLENGKA